MRVRGAQSPWTQAARELRLLMTQVANALDNSVAVAAAVEAANQARFGYVPTSTQPGREPGGRVTSLGHGLDS